MSTYNYQACHRSIIDEHHQGKTHIDEGNERLLVEVVHLHGAIAMEEGHPDVASLFRGPYYSWFSNETKNKRTIRRTILSNVRDVLKVVETHGPFDGIYGFSSGAAVTMLAASYPFDEALRKAIFELDDRSYTFRCPPPTDDHQPDISVPPFRRCGMIGLESTALVASKETSNCVSHLEPFPEEQIDVEMASLPFQYCVLACAATSFGSISRLRDLAGLPPGGIVPMTIPTFHVIGVDDPFRPQSEEFTRLFANRKVMYVPGKHGVSANHQKDLALWEDLRTFIESRGAETEAIAVTKRATEFSVSEVSSILVNAERQICNVKVDPNYFPSESEGGAQIQTFLHKYYDSPFLKNARDASGIPTTYGNLLDFCRGGEGDLRRIGVKNSNEVVAYYAHGSGSVPACAFLTIASQATAAPFGSMTHIEALDALEQFQPTHLVLFSGTESPDITSAFEEYAKTGKAKLHWGDISDNKPGLFRFRNATDEVVGDPLKNSKISLLLRTSGTTSRPKGVPLEQSALVKNACALAAGIGLQESDACYSIMPLHHIGGISASVLATLVSGGSLVCDDKAFNPERMIDAIAISKPTWYSAVPTIHNSLVSFVKNVAPNDRFASYGIRGGLWQNHSLRMIRSGAAALLDADAKALAETFGVPILPTYSMSECMPICQPPLDFDDVIEEKPQSVGVPVIASLAIVSSVNLRVLPFGEVGEIAISGPTVLPNYLNGVGKSSFFEAEKPFERSNGERATGTPWFLTGDLGSMDSGGFVKLTGRAKEIIKKGGEQIHPLEVEECIKRSSIVDMVICFPVPCPIYGEVVGCALVLSPLVPNSTNEVVASIRAMLRSQGRLAPSKWPTKWTVVKEKYLPKTRSNKYKRIGLSTVLGMDPSQNEEEKDLKETRRPEIDWKALSGLRFVLSLYVMFMHIGSDESWGAFANLRGLPWHVHVFFLLAGFSMASPMSPPIQKKLKFVAARIGQQYPLYLIAIIGGMVNLLVVCRPSTFSPNFSYSAKLDDFDRGFFCEGTPATPTSYWWSLVLTILTYAFGGAVFPTFFLSWFLGYYLWFSSMFFQMTAAFPFVYNWVYTGYRGKRILLVRMLVGLFILNAIIMGTFWELGRHAPPYDQGADELTNREAERWNGRVLSFYLFAGFWSVYYFVGVITAFLYDAYNPLEHHRTNWGYLADWCTFVITGLSIIVFLQGSSGSHTSETPELFFRPKEANQWTDTSYVNRLWDTTASRLLCPVTALWVFSLATGSGITARILRTTLLSEWLAPHSYNCFLFHQIVSQWYFAATRWGYFWNWWQYRKTFYWFSPQPCPVEWYEYFVVVSLVVLFSHLVVMNLEPHIVGLLDWMCRKILGRNNGQNASAESGSDKDSSKLAILAIVEDLTGIEPEIHHTLDQCGLASMGIPALARQINRRLEINVSAADLVQALTLEEMVHVVESTKARARHLGV